MKQMVPEVHPIDKPPHGVEVAYDSCSVRSEALIY
jgi:hypothetical protein